ncbi:MAG: HAMP domain-containing sensor histidine kinase [Candidatus Eisenbacteria bacterium]
MGSWQEIRLGNREIERLMTSQAASIIDVISGSGSHGLEAYRSWEDEVVQRLFDDATWIALADSTSRLSSEQLRELGITHDLHRIVIFGPDGVRLASNGPVGSPGSGPGGGARQGVGQGGYGPGGPGGPGGRGGPGGTGGTGVGQGGEPGTVSDGSGAAGGRRGPAGNGPGGPGGLGWPGAGQGAEGAGWRESRFDSADVLGPVLTGETRKLRLGITQARFGPGSRLGVAVARAGGGAIVVNVSADSLRATFDRVGPGHLFRTLGQANGVLYLAIQDESGVLAASEGVRDLSSVEDDPWFASLEWVEPQTQAGAGAIAGRGRGRAFRNREAQAARPPLVTRVTDTPFGRTFEAASLVRLDDSDPVVLRVGLAADALESARSALLRRTWIRTGLLLVLLALAVALLLAWQRDEVLAREVDRVGKELAAREQEAIQSQKLVAMGELASGVAHEVRNPLNAIHMIAQQLERDSALDEDSRGQVGLIKQESRRIEGIVQQFLTFAKPRHPQLETLDLAGVVSSAQKMVAPSFEAAGIGLRVTTVPAEASLDRSFVTEILENLLRNAREATPQGGQVTLALEREGGDHVLSVTDEGPGVPAELRDRIFDLYFTTKSSGTGLGLPLVAQMVASMGGRVRLDESYGPGARFVVRFPIGKERR